MRTGRWVERLRNYSFEVKFRSGITNNVPDMLSRLPTEDIFEACDGQEMIVATLEETLKPIQLVEVVSYSIADPDIQSVRRWLRLKRPRLAQAGRWASVVNELSDAGRTNERR